MSEFHHQHPHSHGKRGVHDHRHGHRGSPVSRWGDPVPWTHWFAEHAHIHADPADDAALTVPPAPGR